MNSENPIVAVIMGSDSDWSTMRDAWNILKEFNIQAEKKVVSAHRTPDDMAQFAKSAQSRGIRVIIAGAGGAAHLPGMVASYTTLPVIGVPIVSKNLNGVDSLYSIVQMPKGVPVATVAIGNAANAALLAIRILGTFDQSISESLKNYVEQMETESRLKTNNLID